jgi:hypothetical protein
MPITNKKLFRWGSSLLLVTIITGSVVGYKLYNKPHRDVAKIEAVAVTGTKLITDYETNEMHADSVYLDKVLEVSGTITEITKNQKGESIIVLEGSGTGTVRCTMEGSVQHEMKTGDSVIIKGICTGYLTDVIMVRGLLQGK